MKNKLKKMGEGIHYPFLTFPAIIDITLYKNNYYDNLLITKLKNESSYIIPDNIADSYLINAEEFANVLYDSFMKEIEFARSLPLADLQKNATSLYFLDKIFTNYKCLRYIKVNVSRDENYSRLNRAEKIPTIFFGYKISLLNIRLDEIFNTTQLRLINDFFITHGIATHDEFFGYDHRIYIKASSLLNILFTVEESEQGAMLLLPLIDNKSEQDDPVISFVTDFEV